MNLKTTGLVALTFCALLSACGGGDDASPAPVVVADPADKYVGTWKTACSGPATLVPSGVIVSSYQTATITKASASSYALQGGAVSFVGAGCTGTGTPVAGETVRTVFTLAGTKTASGVTVDKVTSPASGGTGTAKNISYVNPTGPTLQIGSSSGGVDSDGYPNALDATLFTK